MGGGAFTVEWIAQSEAVVVLLTRELATDPAALFEIWTALSLDVPIITVAVVGMYDFAYAATKLANLSLALETVGEGTNKGLSSREGSERSRPSLTLLRSRRSDFSESDKAAARLKGRLPNDADVVSVGKTIYERLVPTLPNPSMLPTDPCTCLV